ncbi:enoyl-CoA hydratase-related protein [Nocardioides sp. WV_118_6]
MTDTVRWELDDGVAVLTLDRPEQLNAMTAAMAGEIADAAWQAEAEGARVLLVRAEGRAFSAGRDVSDSEPGVEDGGEVLAATYNPMVRAVADLALPTVAAVQGACLGTGLGLALACDVVLVADTARIGSPFHRIGAVLDSGAHKAFVDRLGPAVTLDLIYSGRFLSGTEAAAAGLVSRAVPADELDATAREYAAVVAQGPALAFAESRRLVRLLRDEGRSLAAVLDEEAGAQSRASRTADYREGFTAFLERRPPVFTGS